MRLKCQIEVINRSVASQGIRGGHCKSVQSTLFLAKKSGDVVFLIYCTAKDRVGVKYKVINNIQQIFAKFISEGKATIRLKEPEVDLCIKKANSVDLKLILNALKVGNSGKSLSGHPVLSSMEPAKTKHVQAPPTKLKILARKDYPVSFPTTVKELEVSNCHLARFDSRIFALKNLTSLNLSLNKINVIPTELAQMESLSFLVLIGNEITQFPNSLCCSESNLCRNLKTLDLTDNELILLPPNFYNLKELTHLFLGNNGIKALPRQIGELKKLRRFFAPKNCLKVLPYSLLKLQSLEEVDFFLNPFVPFSCQHLFYRHRLYFTSLQEIAARVIRKHHIHYENCLSWPLVRYLNSGVQCECGTYCFGMFNLMWMYYDLRTFIRSVASIDTSGNCSTYVEVPSCSYEHSPHQRNLKH